MHRLTQPLPFNNQKLLWWVGYYGLIMVKRWRIDFSQLWWVIGGIVAWWFELADRLIYVYVLQPHEQLSVQVQHLIKQRRIKQAIQLLRSRGQEQQRLIGLSIIFLLAWVPVALLLLTSSASWFARGLVMGVGLRAVFVMVQHWSEPNVLKQRLFWQIKRELSDNEVKTVCGVFIAVFVVWSMML